MRIIILEAFLLLLPSMFSLCSIQFLHVVVVSMYLLNMEMRRSFLRFFFPLLFLCLFSFNDILLLFVQINVELIFLVPGFFLRGASYESMTQNVFHRLWSVISKRKSFLFDFTNYLIDEGFAKSDLGRGSSYVHSVDDFHYSLRSNPLQN